MTQQPNKDPQSHSWMRRAIVVLAVMCAVSIYTNWRTLNVITELVSGKCVIGEIKDPL